MVDDFHIAIDGHRLLCEPNTSGDTYLKTLLAVWVKQSPPPRITLFVPFRSEPALDSVLATTSIRLVTSELPFNPVKPFRNQIRWQQIVIPRLLKKCGATVYFSPFHLTPQIPWRVPVVTTIHDLCFLHDPPLRLGSLVHRAQLVSASVRARRLICVSQFTFQMLSAYSRRVARKARVVANGTSRQLISENIAHDKIRPLGLNGNDYFLWIGSPSPRKNLDLLFDAFAAYQVRQAGKKLVIVAPAASHAGLRAMSNARKILPAVCVLDSVDDELLDALYRCAVALIFPSHCEGFGFPVLEASIQGCPTVAHRESPAREILADAIPLAGDFSAESYVTLMHRHSSLLPNERTEQAANLSARAALFTAERMADGTLSVLREAVFGG